MIVRPATDGDRDAWQALLARSTAGDFLHDWGWAAVTALDGQPQRRYVLADGDAIVAIAAAQVRRLPLGRSFWYVPHGPVLDYGLPAARERLRALLVGIGRAARDDRALAVRLEPRLEAGSTELDVLRGVGLRRIAGTLQVAQTRLVTLDDDESLLAGFDKDTRYSVRRAEREGVMVRTIDHGEDLSAIDALHTLVEETQSRAGFPMPPLERYRTTWRSLASAGRATILEARHGDQLLASALLVIEGRQSFYLFSGSRRERRGEPKRYASYAMQWAMMRLARDRGAEVHDLWGVGPPGAGPDHPWHGVGLFKKGFGGREVRWAGSWDLVTDPAAYRLRQAIGMMRGWIGRLRR